MNKKPAIAAAAMLAALVSGSPAFAQQSGTVTCHLNQFESGVKAATSSTISWTAPSLRAGLEYGRSLVLPTDYTRISCLSGQGELASLKCGVTVKFHTDGTTSANRLSCTLADPVPQETATETQKKLDQQLNEMIERRNAE